MELYHSRVTTECLSLTNIAQYLQTSIKQTPSNTQKLGKVPKHPRRRRVSQSGWEKRQDKSFQLQAKEPLGTDSQRTISKNSSRWWLLIGHKKCFVLLCPIGKQSLLSSFRKFVHDSYCRDRSLSGSCTKEIHVVRKLSVGYKICIWFQNTVYPKTKDAVPKIQAWAYKRYSHLHWSRLA